MLVLPFIGILMGVGLFFYMKSRVYRNVIEEIEYLSTNTFKDIDPYNQHEAYKIFNNHFPNYLKEDNINSNAASSTFTE